MPGYLKAFTDGCIIFENIFCTNFVLPKYKIKKFYTPTFPLEIGKIVGGAEDMVVSWLGWIPNIFDSISIVLISYGNVPFHFPFSIYLFGEGGLELTTVWQKKRRAFPRLMFYLRRGSKNMYLQPMTKGMRQWPLLNKNFDFSGGLFLKKRFVRLAASLS